MSKKIIFCIPGREFSGNFLVNWTNLLHHCITNGYDVFMSQKYTSNVYYVRSMCLNADVRLGENQKPFNGKLEYNYMLWIDSDIIFTPTQFEKLISNDKDICGGLYLMDGGKQYAAVENWDENFFEKYGTFQFLTPKDVKGKTEIMEVAYTGFGFLLIKNGVFEKIKYPWFGPKYYNIKNCYDFASEDVSFCMRARENGFKIYIDPTVIVGHEKSVIY